MISKVLYQVAFTTVSSITVTHSTGYYYPYIRVVIGGVYRTDLIQAIYPDPTDPTNKCIVKLTSSQTGYIQVLSVDILEATPRIIKKETWVPANYAANFNNYRVQTITTNGTGNFTFKIPDDLVSFVSCQLIGISVNTNAAANIDLSTQYAAVGEAYNANSETNTTTTYVTTANRIIAINLLTVLTGAAASDLVGLIVTQTGTGSIYYLGVKIIYYCA